MSYKTAYSPADDVGAAVEQIKSEFQGMEIKLVVYFSTSSCDVAGLAAGMEKAFAPAAVIGCTTAGEITSGRMLKGSVTAMALGADAVAGVQTALVENLKQGADPSAAFAAFEDRLGKPMSELDFEKFVGIALVDGLSGAEEKLMDRIGDMTNVLFVGGSAGDDVNFQATHVFCNGRAATNAAVLALIEPAGGWSILKTQSFTELDRKLVATKVDQARRAVIEFDGKPAAQAYAEAVGTTVDKAADFFMTNPVGLMIDGEPYVRSPQQVQGDQIVFYCNIAEGMELSLLESRDIVADTARALEEEKARLGRISALINFHCILRTLELEQKEQTEAYGKLFAQIPTVGFSTYGEEYLGHINQTSTMLVFK